MVTEKGTVKFFNPAEGKRFGFIRTESGEEIFFHFGDGEVISVSDSGQPEWGGWDKKLAREPKRGDNVVFQRKEGKHGKGPKACPWGLADEYDHAIKKIGERKGKYPVGLYFRGEPGHVEHEVVHEPGMVPHNWNTLVPRASLFSKWPIVQGRELVINEYKRRIESDRALIKDYEFFLANPPRLEMDANGNGSVYYRDLNLEVKDGRITKGGKSSDCPMPFGIGNWVWYKSMGGVDMEVLKDDAAIIAMLQTNAVNPAIPFHKPLLHGDSNGYDATVNKVKNNRIIALWQLVNSHAVYIYLTNPEAKQRMEEVRQRAERAVAKAGKVVAKRSCYPDEEFSLATDGKADGSLKFFAIAFNSIGQDYDVLGSDELMELQVKVKRLGYAPCDKKKQGVSWAKIAEPFRREIAELIGFGDLFEAWLEIYGR